MYRSPYPLLALLLLLLVGFATAQPPSENIKPIQTFSGHGEAVYAVALSPDGKLAATGSFDKIVRVFETASGKQVRAFGGPQGHQNLVLSIAFSPDGSQLASGTPITRQGFGMSLRSRRFAIIPRSPR